MIVATLEAVSDVLARITLCEISGIFQQKNLVNGSFRHFPKDLLVARRNTCHICLKPLVPVGSSGKNVPKGQMLHDGFEEISRKFKKASKDISGILTREVLRDFSRIQDIQDSSRGFQWI